jgi:hypothetical protein
MLMFSCVIDLSANPAVIPLIRERKLEGDAIVAAPADAVTVVLASGSAGIPALLTERGFGAGGIPIVCAISA